MPKWTVWKPLKNKPFLLRHPVIMISGHGNIDTAVESCQKGAFDFIQKPPDLNRLLITFETYWTIFAQKLKEKSFKKKVSARRVQEIIGNSDSISVIKETIEKVAPTDARVLITGQKWNRKELVARWIHQYSRRKRISNWRSTVPPYLQNSLNLSFGHEKDPLSAVKQRLGKFEQAHGGTLFWMKSVIWSLSAQSKKYCAQEK